jgi:long-chain acyl-CoA synthetase
MPHQSLIESFLRTADRHRNRVALAAKVDGEYRPSTYAETAERVRRLGAHLIGMGVQPGDRVALFSDNRPEWAISDLGTLAAGAVLVPLYATLPAPQVEYILRDSGARVLIVTGQKRLEIALSVRANLPDLEQIIVIDAPAPEGTHAFEALLEEDAPEYRAESERRVAALGEADLATIVYTSGTTGEPKGAMLTHGNLLCNVGAMRAVLSLTPSDIFLSFLPLSHIFERSCGSYLPLTTGAAVYYAESLFTVAKNLEEVRPTIMMSVPRLYENMRHRILEAASKAKPAQRVLLHWALRVGHERTRCRLERRFAGPGLRLRHAIAERLVLRKLRQRMGGRIRFFISGGAPLPPDACEFFFDLGLVLLQGYGLTETSPVVAVNRPADPRPYGIGPALDNLEVKIADDGELLVRGPSVMQGYWKKPEETQAAIDAEGWFHTGDIARMDPDGHLHITDRKKNLIVLSTGKKVAPQPIEGRLSTSPFIGDVLLLGDRRSTIGALVVPCFDALREQDGLAGLENAELAASPVVRQLIRAEIDRLSDGLAEFERIKRFAVLDREFSLDAGEITPTLKPRRDVIMEHFAPQVQSIFTRDA